MIKRDIVETIYEYDEESRLTRKTVTETHEEKDTLCGYTTTYTPCITGTDSSTAFATVTTIE